MRPFVEGDIDQVSRVHRAAFKLDDAVSQASHREYFTRVFIENPSGQGPLPSLVYEDDAGRILGFLGVVPRRLGMDGHRYQAVVSSQFIVDPAGPVALVALRLVKAYLDGPQDLSIADEANDVARTIWEGLGGTTVRLLSIYWTRPLRPARLAVSSLRRRHHMPPFMAAAAAPVAKAIDALATRMGGGRFRQPGPSAGVDEWCGRTVLAQGPELCGGESLRVHYDERAFQWLLDRAAAAEPGGRVLKAVPRKGQKVLGWYVCHLDRDGLAEVLQMAAAPSSMGDVLDHLFHQAWQEGAVAVTGRLQPRFMQALSDKYCLFHRRGPWVLIKTKTPRILDAFQAGDAWFSRLDGEWSLRFQPAAH